MRSGGYLSTLECVFDRPVNKDLSNLDKSSTCLGFLMDGRIIKHFRENHTVTATEIFTLTAKKHMNISILKPLDSLHGDFWNPKLTGTFSYEIFHLLNNPELYSITICNQTNGSYCGRYSALPAAETIGMIMMSLSEETNKTGLQKNNNPST